MKRFIQVAVRWLSAGRSRSDAPDITPRAGEPEHERRLRALQENGRTLFLP